MTDQILLKRDNADDLKRQIDTLLKNKKFKFFAPGIEAAITTLQETGYKTDKSIIYLDLVLTNGRTISLPVCENKTSVARQNHVYLQFGPDALNIEVFNDKAEKIVPMYLVAAASYQ